MCQRPTDKVKDKFLIGISLDTPFIFLSRTKMSMRYRNQVGRFAKWQHNRTVSSLSQKSHPRSSDAICTHMRRTIPTQSQPHHVPLTLVDVHMRHEQLPFAYFFEETLDSYMLETSLQEVLYWFPVLGGRIHKSRLYIECTSEDMVPLAFGEVNMSFSEWFSEKQRGHIHKGGNGHPVLLSLFDPLFEPQEINAHNNNQRSDPRCKYENLVTIRVTYFKGGGTAIAVNFNHALGDTASCVRFVECWGRSMRLLSYPRGACNQRANANCSGMITEELADVMGLGRPTTTRSELFDTSGVLTQFLSHFYSNMKNRFFPDMSSRMEERSEDITNDDESSLYLDHEYLHLQFPQDTLNAMKAFGMKECHSCDEFVSTNDMITAVGWLMKRGLSGQEDWNISMAVNLRGRCGVEAFSDMNSVDSTTTGVFGNGITAFHASLPPTCYNFKLTDISAAAICIRKALTAGLSGVPDRIALSKIGKATSLRAGSTFSTASWLQFPLWNIQFSTESKLVAFHGHPAHPLPTGRTFSSVIVPTSDGGCTYKLLLPSDKAEEAKVMQRQICNSFLDWHDKKRLS